MPSFNKTSIPDLVDGLRSGNRSSLAKAITLVESRSEKHIASAAELLDACLPFTGNSIRIGITGSPGVGKSTFINAFGEYLIQTHRKKVAVLAIDPSSTRSGGSILGDKTRMPGLSSNPKAFVRPSPNSGDLGGVAARTRESILLCEAAGFDIVIIETVGVGQSEIAVHDMVDIFMLLLLPGSGDDLQGIKRGIVEMTDILVVNKADGDLLKRAKDSSSFYSSALSLGSGSRENWKVKIELVSSTLKKGLENVWDDILDFRETQMTAGSWNTNRQSQNVKWFQYHLEQEVLRSIQQSEKLDKMKSEMLQKLSEGDLHPLMAARALVKKFFE